MKNYFYPADILLPKKNFTEWSVIACDQYTSEPEYWSNVKETVSDKPSALNVILPEVYLKKDNSQAINKINATMEEYLNNDVFDCYDNSMILTSRTLKDGKIRNGIVGLIDLEDYSYEIGANTLIRATEKTVIERIPPRVNIRCDASLEIPHIMLLIDDADNTVIEPLFENRDNLKKVYDFDLIMNAGSIKGYLLDDDSIEKVNIALGKLKDNSKDGFLFAVGDGNHSLASAKECYKEGKGPRYAMAEIVNIHDTSLQFEPIYRIIKNINPNNVIEDFVSWCGGEYYGDDAQKFTCVFGNEKLTVSLKPHGSLHIATLQSFLDDYLKDNEDAVVDYIHGTDSLVNLSKAENTVGFIFEGMSKNDLFYAVSQDGSLPRKTFSMGCADDKRFYLEARKIK